MLTPTPRAWYFRNLRVLNGNEEVALLDRHRFRERASFRRTAAAASG